VRILPQASSCGSLFGVETHFVCGSTSEVIRRVAQFYWERREGFPPALTWEAALLKHNEQTAKKAESAQGAARV